jgi:tRNA-specific 2-thiouridylase
MPEGGRHVLVKLRSSQEPFPARAYADRAVLDAPAFGIAAGQACVVYDGDRVLGGGWIARAENNALKAAA